MHKYITLHGYPTGQLSGLSFLGPVWPAGSLGIQLVGYLACWLPGWPATYPTGCSSWIYTHGYPWGLIYEAKCLSGLSAGCWPPPDYFLAHFMWRQGASTVCYLLTVRRGHSVGAASKLALR